MPIHSYTPGEMSPLTDIREISRRAISYGYTGVSIGHSNDADGEFFSVTVDQADTEADVLANIKATTAPTLTLSTYDLQVAGDGVSTGDITVTDSRGPAASGKTVQIGVGQVVQLSSVSLVLDGSGQAAVTFGPSPSSGTVSGKIGLTFGYESGEAEPVYGTAQYT